MTQTLFGAVQDALDRLGDLQCKVWSREEMQLYVQEGYDQFCRQAKPLFDIWVIENLPPVGNWQTDLEKYLIQRMPGMGYTDSPFHFTADSSRTFGINGRYGGSYSGPTGVTSPGQLGYIADLDTTDSVPTAVTGGPLPDGTVEVLRVTYDDRELYAIGSAQARRIDPNYENLTGDPQYYTFDKDGIFYLRLIPKANGDAVYDDVDGSWGTMKYTDDSTVEVVTTEVTGVPTNGFGILRHRTDMFPAFGPWGSPTRVHPTGVNIKVEMYRLGRSLDNFPVELPTCYRRYPLYWAMSQALRRDGPGQDIELADHYEQRFAMGVHFMTEKRGKMDRERVGRLTGSPTIPPFGLGLPQAPYPYENRW